MDGLLLISLVEAYRDRSIVDLVKSSQALGKAVDDGGPDLPQLLATTNHHLEQLSTYLGNITQVMNRMNLSGPDIDDLCARTRLALINPASEYAQ